MRRIAASIALLLGLALVALVGSSAPAGAAERELREIELSTEDPNRTAAVGDTGLEGALVVSFGVLLVLTSVLGPWTQRESASDLDRSLRPARVRVDR